MKELKLRRFRETDSMSKLIGENHFTLFLLSRFGIPLGFGEKSIAEVCQENNVDLKTFLAIVNLLLSGPSDVDKDISLNALIDYLHHSHTYFLDYRLPEIRAKLIQVLEPQLDTLNKAVLGYFDAYIEAITQHMTYEENTVFPYVKSLIEGKKKKNFNIHTFSREHEGVESKLTEFKNILIKYYPTQSTNELNSVLFDIFNCEKDLESHNAIEDYLLDPAIERLENHSKDTQESLTSREKEIIVYVIKGLTNKQIAEQLFISTHTVISHRRNIAQKLQIHSTAGLTIYAIVNKLVDLEEIE
ncbi:helix-turn-helix transcriptional regulator [Bacteroidales bacterium OttesenSCG-928-J19]|nr:helix-turn-helix transcriptional regulator [Bacteroidales bacterium OttesenSCG-928-J19]